MRLWLKFARSDEMSFISHLDAHRAYERLLRRAGLPLAMSKGFNPHPLLSLATPLPLGFGSESDYLDLTLSGFVSEEEIWRTLQSTSGSPNMRLSGLRVVPDTVPPLGSMVQWAGYQLSLDAPIAVVTEAAAWFVAQPTLAFAKQTKRGVREVDAKLLVSNLAPHQKGLDVVLSMADPAVLRPEEFIGLLSSGGFVLSLSEVKRYELYSKNLVAPLDIIF